MQFPDFPSSERGDEINLRHQAKVSGGKGTRTPDIQLAKLALYQLSYTPVGFGRKRPWRAPKPPLARGRPEFVL